MIHEPPRDGEVLLISCYELGHQPLGVALPRAFLERAGFRVATLDVSVDPLDERRFRAARFIGISVPMHTALKIGVRVVRRVRAVNASCHICFYGLYATLNAEYLLEAGADSVLGGECEEALVERVSSCLREPKSLPPVTPPVRERLSFPLPSRRGLPPLEQYAHLDRNGRFQLAGYVEASRGCLHQCRHCPIPPVYGGRFFVVPVETVLADIRQLAAAGATHITFGDPDFLNGPRHALAIVRALHEELPDLTFDVTAKIEHLIRHRILLDELARCGCLFIVSAAESLSDTVLTQLDKRHTCQDVFEALEAVREAGMALRPTFVPFTPWSTLEDILELVEWVSEEDLIAQIDPVQFTIRLLVPPGSLLLERATMKGFLGPLERDSLTYRWTHPDPRMDALQRDLAQLVERETREQMPALATFERIRTLVWKTAGRPLPSFPATRHRHRSVPRLTEPWFC